MFTFSRVVRAPPKGHSIWPWPVELPLKKVWFPKLSRKESLADDTKRVLLFGDLAVCGVVAFALYRCVSQHKSGVHQTRLKHLTSYPPAIIAQEFDFENASNNRKVERAQLDSYRDEFAQSRTTGAPVESFIFKY